MSADGRASVERFDIVKLGPTAREMHTVIGGPFSGRVFVKQQTTGVVRSVSVDRCIVIGRAGDSR